MYVILLHAHLPRKPHVAVQIRPNRKTWTWELGTLSHGLGKGIGPCMNTSSTQPLGLLATANFSGPFLTNLCLVIGKFAQIIKFVTFFTHLITACCCARFRSICSLDSRLWRALVLIGACLLTTVFLEHYVRLPCCCSLQPKSVHCPSHGYQTRSSTQQANKTCSTM